MGYCVPYGTLAKCIYTDALPLRFPSPDYVYIISRKVYHKLSKQIVEAFDHSYKSIISLFNFYCFLHKILKIAYLQSYCIVLYISVSPKAYVV